MTMLFSLLTLLSPKLRSFIYFFQRNLSLFHENLLILEYRLLILFHSLQYKESTRSDEYLTRVTVKNEIQT